MIVVADTTPLRYLIFIKAVNVNRSKERQSPCR